MGSNVSQAATSQVTTLNQTAQQQQQQQQAQQSNQQAQQQQQTNQTQSQTQQQSQQSQQQLTTIPGTNIQIPTSVAAANGIIAGNNIKLDGTGILNTKRKR